MPMILNVAVVEHHIKSNKICPFLLSYTYNYNRAFTKEK